jgi:hypothetical protein
MSLVKLGSLVVDDFKAALHDLRWSKDVKAATTWKILPVDKKITEELDNYEKLRLELCKKYAKKGENDEPIMIPMGEGGLTQFTFEKENAMILQKEINGLLEQDVALPDPVIKISDLLEQSPDIKISLGSLSLLVGVVLADA